MKQSHAITLLNSAVLNRTSTKHSLQSFTHALLYCGLLYRTLTILGLNVLNHHSTTLNTTAP
jgi:hypothetical protein